MRVEQFDPEADGGSLNACYQVQLATDEQDAPDLPQISFAAFKGNWQGWGGSSSDPRQAGVARDHSGEALGCYLLRLPERDNRAAAFCDLRVKPGERRAGIGSALLAQCADRARRAGRSRLLATAWVGTAGEAFAQAKGASGGIEQVLRTMAVEESLPARLTELRADAEPHAAGYEVVAWQIPSPEELLGEIAEMERVMADAPRDEGIEPHAVDADMVRMTEQTILARGLRYYLAAARHSGTGQIVALTEMAVDQNTPQWGFQQATAVQPAHRGHRLGLLVKIGMLDLLAEREPGVRHIFTGNAGSNEHMVAINELLGYRAAATSRSWELDLTRS